jgi:hypothetical protein
LHQAHNSLERGALADAVAIEWWGKAGETTSEEVMSASHPANHRGVASHRHGDPTGRAERAADARSSERVYIRHLARIAELRALAIRAGSAQDPEPISAHFTLKSNPIFQGMSFPPFPHPQKAPAKL